MAPIEEPKVVLQPCVCAQPFTPCVSPCVFVQACRGGGEVPGASAAPPADVSGQTNHQQRDGAGEDEEGRATDAAAKPPDGESGSMFFALGAARRTAGQQSNVFTHPLCLGQAESAREEERRPHVHQEPSAEAGEHRQTDQRGDQGETHVH